MDILQIKDIIQNILKRKNLHLIVKNTDILYPDYFSSLEITELLLTIDKITGEYIVAKLDINNLTISTINNALNKDS